MSERRPRCGFTWYAEVGNTGHYVDHRCGESEGHTGSHYCEDCDRDGPAT